MQILKHLVYSYVLMLLLISHMAVFLCNDETVSKKENIICPEIPQPYSQHYNFIYKNIILKHFPKYALDYIRSLNAEIINVLIFAGYLGLCADLAFLSYYLIIKPCFYVISILNYIIFCFNCLVSIAIIFYFYNNGKIFGWDNLAIFMSQKAEEFTNFVLNLINKYLP